MEIESHANPTMPLDFFSNDTEFTNVIYQFRRKKKEEEEKEPLGISLTIPSNL